MPPIVRAASQEPSRHLGRFIIVRDLGQGGMGTVHQAWDTRLARWVAIKFLKTDSADEEIVQRFRQEAAVVASMDHPNIAQVYDAVESKGRYALIMKYIDGRTLQQMYMTEPKEQSPIETVVKLVRDASIGLGYAHTKGFIHRDIKPSNLMMDKEGRLYVLDFGLAKVLTRPNGLTEWGRMMGTPAYMSPEQAMGMASQLDPRSDVYSLGITLWALLVGKPPFVGKNELEVVKSVVRDPVPPIRTRRSDVPKPLESALLMAVEKDRDARYTTGIEFASALNECLVDLEKGQEESDFVGPLSPIQTPCTVLLIEDDLALASLVKKSLAQDGVHVIHIADGNDAMESVHHAIPDLVVLDLNLPGQSGWSVLRKLREMASYNHVPILIATGEGGEGNEVKGFQMGADDYIEKPFSMAVLRVRMRKLLGQRTAL